MISNFIICHKRYFEILRNRCASELLYFFKQQRKGWFIITIDELRSIFFGSWGRDSIRKALNLLSDLGMVIRRHTRLNGRAWEYQFVSEEPTTVAENQTTVAENQTTVVENQTTVVENQTTVVGNQTTTYIQDPLLNPSLDPPPDPWLDKKEKKEDIVQEECPEIHNCSDNEAPVTQSEPDPSQDKCSAASSPIPNKRTTEKQKEVWEIAPSRPYPVFLNWWAATKYKPQGGHWAADALGNAYAEFYNNREKTAIAIFPQFLEYMSRVTENCDELLNAEFKALLPSCFVLKPESTQENVQRLMERVQSLVEKGVEVALPTDTATPSYSQSMSFEASRKETLPFTPLEPRQLTGPLAVDNAWGCDRTLANEVAKYRSRWKYAPTERKKIFEWVNNTPGVTLGVDGPELEEGMS